MLSAQTEEYLEAIRRLEERSEPATTSALARDLGVSAPSVTEMVRRLVELGLLTRRQRGEIHLTDTGRTIGTTVVRRHRLWERFLTDVLGLPWDNVHSEACRLEHATSPDTEERLAQALGEGATCPHGHAIPGPDGVTSREISWPMSGSAVGETVVVATVDESEHVLRRVGELGIWPGTRVVALARGADGDMCARIAGRELTIPAELQASVRVVPANNRADSDETISLAELPSSRAGAVREIGGGGSFAARCLALGFTPGTRVQMVQNIGRGPVIVTVRDTRIALGRGEASAITVTPVD